MRVPLPPSGVVRWNPSGSYFALEHMDGTARRLLASVQPRKGKD